MNDERAVYFNGDFIPESQAGIPIADAGVIYGHMVFEYTRTFNHKPFRLQQHIDRLYASLRYAEIDSRMTIAQMLDATLETIDRNRPLFLAWDDMAIMHNVSNGPMPQFGPMPAGGPQPTVLIYTWPISKRYSNLAKLHESGVAAVIPSQRALPARLIDPKAKNRSRMFYAMAEIQARRVQPEAWALLLDEDGYATEGSGSNFLIVKNGELLSPEPRNILLGVTRAAVIQLAEKLRIPFRETNLGAYELYNADEAFFCSTPYVMLPVASVDGHRMGASLPGPVTKRLMDAFIDLVGMDFVAQARTLALQAAMPAKGAPVGSTR